MYVSPALRGKDIAAEVLFVLEDWAKELSFEKSVWKQAKGNPRLFGFMKNVDICEFQITGNTLELKTVFASRRNCN